MSIRTESSRTTYGWCRVGLAIAALANFLLVAVLPFRLELTPAQATGLRLGLFLAGCALSVLALWVSSRYIRKSVVIRSKETTPLQDERTAIVFVHGMGVQDKYQMVVDFSDGLRASSTGPYQVRSSSETQIRTDAVLLTMTGPDGKSQGLDVYEAYWGHLFNGLTRWQGTLLFGTTTLFKAIPTLFTRVGKKRALDVGYTLLASSLLFFAFVTFYGGFRISTKRLQLPEPGQMSAKSVNALPVDATLREAILANTLRDRGRETRTFIRQSFAEGLASLRSSLDWQGDFSKAIKNLSQRPIPALATAIAYSVAGFYMIVAFLSFLSTSGSYSGKASQLNALRAHFLTGAAATAVWILLDPAMDILLVEAMVCATLLYLLIWGLKYWFTNFLGDVQIYTSTNANSTFFKARDQAIDLVEKRLIEVVEAGYGRVIVVGHSLGSAVALSAIRRLSLNPKVNPTMHPQLPPSLCAFVTIGSPLRKIRQLFQTKPYKWNFVEFNTEVDRHLFGMDRSGSRWYNYYYATDIFADRLAYVNLSRRQKSVIDGRDITGFRVHPENDRALTSPPKIWSHSHYWQDPVFVNDLMELVATGEISSSLGGWRLF